MGPPGKKSERVSIRPFLFYKRETLLGVFSLVSTDYPEGHNFSTDNNQIRRVT